MSAKKKKYTSNRHQTTPAEAAILWDHNAMYWRVSEGEFKLEPWLSAKVQMGIKTACTVKLKKVLNSAWTINKVREWFNRHSPTALARPGRRSGPVGGVAHASRLAEDPDPLIVGDQSSAPRVELAKPVGNPESRPEPVFDCWYTEGEDVKWWEYHSSLMDDSDFIW
jgi:hypothetical protein